MKKVYQTIVDKGHGNCMQAAVASLFDLELEEVPNFIELEEGNGGVLQFMYKRGFDACYINRYRHESTEFLRKVAKFDGGVNGYLYATVPSQTFTDVHHAVIVDLDLNIIHDPNPNQLAMKLTPDDVTDFITMRDMVIGKTGKLFTIEEWDAASEEEKDLNTHKQNEKSISDNS